MSQKQPLFTIIIPTYNGKNLSYDSQPYIENCLEAALNQIYPNVEIIVVDNDSQDKTKNYLKDLSQKERIKIIFNSKNLGFSAAHNQGIKESRGEFALCLNQDVILDSNFLEEAAKTFQQDNKIAAVQPKIWQWDTKNSDQKRKETIDTTGLIALKTGRFIARGQGQKDQNQFEEQKEVFGADGAAPVFRKKALEDIKLVFPRNGIQKEEYFDEDFFMYKEDVDLAWRIRLFGWKTVYQPRCLAWHNRTSGESAARNYYDIIKERRKIGKFSKELSFKNHRLLLIKNMPIELMWRFLPRLAFNEIGAWMYVLLFERYIFSAIAKLFQQIPLILEKRKLIMAKKRISARELAKWFE